MDNPPLFNSVEDECRYWKERAKFYHKEWADAKQEFDEFVEDSRQLEIEMETTLEQKESVIRDLRKQVVKLEKENESLRIKLDSFSIEFGNLEQQLTIAQRERDNMKSYLRQLEQKNDDLERAHRILSESIAGFEAMLDKAYEKNALLEIEVDEKEVLQEKLQRLMDETRDLKQELNVKSRHTTSTNMNGVIDKCLENTNQNHAENEIQTVTSSPQQQQPSPPPPPTSGDISHSLKRPENILNGNAAMTASSRTTALNIVADMLRKLNLDKTLLCSRCDKFRCICERLPSPTTTTTTDPNSNVTSQLHKNDLSTSSTSSVTSPTNSSSTTSLNFGSNVFKRFTQKVSGLGTMENSSNNHAMESKLKAYREQIPATPRQ